MPESEAVQNNIAANARALARARVQNSGGDPAASTPEPDNAAIEVAANGTGSEGTGDAVLSWSSGNVKSGPGGQGDSPTLSPDLAEIAGVSTEALAPERAHSGVADIAASTILGQ
jgi:hypothetical protein